MVLWTPLALKTFEVVRWMTQFLLAPCAIVQLCRPLWKILTMVMTLCWGTHSGRDFLQLWAQADPNATARRQNQPLPSKSDVLLSVSNVQKSVMHVWNWLATHCVAGCCCMEREITISSPNNSKWSRAWRDLYIDIYIYINIHIHIIHYRFQK